MTEICSGQTRNATAVYDLPLFVFKLLSAVKQSAANTIQTLERSVTIEDKRLSLAVIGGVSVTPTRPTLSATKVDLSPLPELPTQHDDDDISDASNGEKKARSDIKKGRDLLREMTLTDLFGLADEVGNWEEPEAECQDPENQQQQHQHTFQPQSTLNTNLCDESKHPNSDSDNIHLNEEDEYRRRSSADGPPIVSVSVNSLDAVKSAATGSLSNMTSGRSTPDPTGGISKCSSTSFFMSNKKRDSLTYTSLAQSGVFRQPLSMLAVYESKAGSSRSFDSRSKNLDMQFTPIYSVNSSNASLNGSKTDIRLRRAENQSFLITLDQGSFLDVSPEHGEGAVLRRIENRSFLLDGDSSDDCTIGADHALRRAENQSFLGSKDGGFEGPIDFTLRRSENQSFLFETSHVGRSDSGEFRLYRAANHSILLGVEPSEKLLYAGADFKLKRAENRSFLLDSETSTSFSNFEISGSNCSMDNRIFSSDFEITVEGSETGSTQQLVSDSQESISGSSSSLSQPPIYCLSTKFSPIEYTELTKSMPGKFDLRFNQSAEFNLLFTPPSLPPETKATSAAYTRRASAFMVSHLPTERTFSSLPKCQSTEMHGGQPIGQDQHNNAGKDILGFKSLENLGTPKEALRVTSVQDLEDRALRNLSAKEPAGENAQSSAVSAQRHSSQSIKNPQQPRLSVRVNVESSLVELEEQTAGIMSPHSPFVEPLYGGTDDPNHKNSKIPSLTTAASFPELQSFPKQAKDTTVKRPAVLSPSFASPGRDHTLSSEATQKTATNGTSTTAANLQTTKSTNDMCNILSDLGSKIDQDILSMQIYAPSVQVSRAIITPNSDYFPGGQPMSPTSNIPISSLASINTDTSTAPKAIASYQNAKTLSAPTYPAQAILIPLQGMNKVQILDLTNLHTLGRVSSISTSNPFFKGFGSRVVSRNHAQIWSENGKVNRLFSSLSHSKLWAFIMYYLLNLLKWALIFI
jgi:hypothetical protein